MKALARLGDLEPKGMEAWLSHLMDWESPLHPTEINAAEFGLLRQFIESGDHAALWKYLNHHANRPALRALTKELLALQESGVLKTLFEFLAQFEDPRLRELARVFARWDSSGELNKFLQALQTIQ